MGSSRGSPVSAAQPSKVAAPPGAEKDVSCQSERSRMSGGMRVRHVCIGRPKVLTFRTPRRWAETDRPYGPAPTTATSSRSVIRAATSGRTSSLGWGRRMRVPPVPYPAKACVTRARSVAWLARAGRDSAPLGLRLLFYHRVADDDATSSPCLFGGFASRWTSSPARATAPSTSHSSARSSPRVRFLTALSA